ncbi:MAG: hypothetical protein ACRDV9_12565 [Acidimicrobiia bacterium]
MVVSSDVRRLAGGISSYRGVDTTNPVLAHGATVDVTADMAVEAPSLDAGGHGRRRSPAHGRRPVALTRSRGADPL